ncbi:hypothetical protein, partial [Pseudomonas gessardii]|uniref:hypothetical protein n=1 Tax=Pseudomonas gessardii TaxID=78544 RepID=UPI001F1D37BA
MFSVIQRNVPRQQLAHPIDRVFGNVLKYVGPVFYTHLTLPAIRPLARFRVSPLRLLQTLSALRGVPYR